MINTFPRAIVFLEEPRSRTFRGLRMTGSLPRGLLAGVFLLMLSGWASAAPPHPPPLWWRSEEIVKELGLTADQSVRIGKIFQDMRPELRQEYDELDRL